MALFKGERDKVGRDDMTTLREISEKSMIENLKERYYQKEIFTSIGSVIITLNPYCDIGVFNKSNISKYKGKQSYELAPHVFTCAEETYRSLITTNNDQCIIIGGESGAGKTENSKGIMKYLAKVTGSSGSSGVGNVKKVILESNPLLETFGNAKTLRNNNSSRFGKYIEILFCSSGASSGGAAFSISGGKITNYLLEKSRVVTHTAGERNFHSFYQLFQRPNALSEFKLNCYSNNTADVSQAMSAFPYLVGDSSFGSDPNVFTADGINDSSWYQDAVHAMKTMGISETSINGIWSVLAGILHLGKVTFQEKKNIGGSGSGTTVDNSTSLSLDFAASFLGIPREILERALLFRNITSGSARVSTYAVPQNQEGALYSRDALAKGVYSRLFNWLVQVTNKSMAFTGSGSTIGILDIYGFEIFQLNSFEQLCINFVNETLHQIFIDLTLKTEQQEYVKEGIPWEEVHYTDNKPTVDFLQGRPMGLFSVLDEECLFPKGQDMTFLEKMQRNFGNSKCFKIGSIQQRVFSVRHYAGDVTYSVDGFLDKNRDTFFDDLNQACLSSDNPVLKEISELANATTPGSPSSKVGGAKQRPITGGSQFRKSVEELLKKLYSCQPHYIRTIKPNDEKKPLTFDEARVSEQARYLGLLENLRVRRAGFCHRTTYERWIKRYGVCHESSFLASGPVGDKVETIKMILGSVGINHSSYALGKTKLFLRDPVVLYKMEDARLHALERIASKVKGSKCPPKLVEGNVCLEYLRILVFEELDEFTVFRHEKRGGDISYRSYNSLEADYVSGAIEPQELRSSLHRSLTDSTEPIREHFVQTNKSKRLKSAVANATKSVHFKGFFKFFKSGKQQTATLTDPSEPSTTVASPPPPSQPSSSNPPVSSKWNIGDKVRAKYSADGNMYPAILKNLKGEMFFVSYPDYDNFSEWTDKIE